MTTRTNLRRGYVSGEAKRRDAGYGDFCRKFTGRHDGEVDQLHIRIGGSLHRLTSPGFAENREKGASDESALNRAREEPVNAEKRWFSTNIQVMCHQHDDQWTDKVGECCHKTRTPSFCRSLYVGARQRRPSANAKVKDGWQSLSTHQYRTLKRIV